MAERMATVSCTIVVPTFNRRAALARCLNGLTDQDYPKDLWEVVVVDDGGHVQLDDIIEAARDRLQVRLLRKDHRGPAHARNHGVQHAHGELIAFTDDDCKPEPDWLRQFAAAHAAIPAAILGGHTWNALPDNPYATASQLLIDYLYTYYNSRWDDARFFTSNNMAVQRAAFLEVGGFDPLFRYAAGEDRELCARWRHLGRPLVYIPAARVAHAHALRMRTFVRQHVGYGRGAYYFRIREAQRTEEGVKLEPPRFYTNMMRLPFRQLGWFGGLGVASLLVLAQAGNAAGYYLEKFRPGQNGGRRAPLNPVAMTTEGLPAARGSERESKRSGSWRSDTGREQVRPATTMLHRDLDVSVEES